MGASYLRANPAAPPQTLQAIERRCILALRRPPAEDGLPCLRHADKAPSAQCGHSPSSVIAKSSPTRRRRCARSTTAHAPPGGGHGAQQHAAAGNRTLSSSKRGPTSLSSSSEKTSLGLVGPFAVGPAARARARLGHARKFLRPCGASCGSEGRAGYLLPSIGRNLLVVDGRAGSLHRMVSILTYFYNLQNSIQL